jgi:hypothetical protein
VRLANAVNSGISDSEAPIATIPHETAVIELVDPIACRVLARPTVNVHSAAKMVASVSGRMSASRRSSGFTTHAIPIPTVATAITIPSAVTTPGVFTSIPRPIQRLLLQC